MWHKTFDNWILILLVSKHFVLFFILFFVQMEKNVHAWLLEDVSWVVQSKYFDFYHIHNYCFRPFFNFKDNENFIFYFFVRWNSVTILTRIEHFCINCIKLSSIFIFFLITGQVVLVSVIVTWTDSLLKNLLV